MKFSLVPRLSSLLSPLAKRFVAGETAEEAIQAARHANDKGITAILDYLGEDITSADDARKASDEYLRLLSLIHGSGVRAAVSLKVSQMGILLSREVCVENIRRVAEEAARLGIRVWFDMEGSALTQKTIDVFSEVRRNFSNLGLCLQAALVRTGSDLDHLARTASLHNKPFCVRLCRGAYKESPQTAYTLRSALEGNFRMLIQKAFDQAGKSVYPAFATHDPGLLDYILTQAREKKVPMDRFEFQMLYGIRNQRLAALVKEGFQGSVYIPYGSHWFPYFMRRLRERRENVYFLLRNLFQV